MVPQLHETDTLQSHAVNNAFSRQASGFDQADRENPVLQDLRQQVYLHVDQFLKPNSHILELNAGTGIDALALVSKGHRVTATDLSDGMVKEISRKITQSQLQSRIRCFQLSYEKIGELEGEKFDYVFSNFGGLNCIPDLKTVTRHLPVLLMPGAFVTWVIMPPICPWELGGLFAGHGAKALRRFKKNGVKSHLEGEYFTTYYHSLKQIRAALGAQFKLEKVEGLASISPPPHRADLPVQNPRFYKLLRNLDRSVKNSFPFNRWADHIITTFRFEP